MISEYKVSKTDEEWLWQVQISKKSLAIKCQVGQAMYALLQIQHILYEDWLLGRGPLLLYVVQQEPQVAGCLSKGFPFIQPTNILPFP